MTKIGSSILKKARKIPPPVEIATGAVIVCVPPVPDPSDAVGILLIGDGIRRMKNNGKINVKKHKRSKKGSKRKVVEVRKYERRRR